MNTIAITNQKGGVGKTTTAANLGAALAAAGLDTCLVDMDPQGHLTLHFDIDPNNAAPSIYEVLIGQATLSMAAERIARTLCVLPASPDLAAAPSEISSESGWEYRLRNALQAASDLPHEYVLIDCPPSLGTLTINSLVAADNIIIPLQPHFLAMHGLASLLDTIVGIKGHLNPDLKVAGILFCMYETITRLSGDITSEIRNFINAARNTDMPWAGARLFETTVRRNIRLAECPSHGQTIFDYDPRCHGAIDYRALKDEFLSVFPPEQQGGESREYSAHRNDSTPAAAIETPETGSALVEPEPPLEDTAVETDISDTSQRPKED